MLTAATQRSAPPYLAVTAGPASHSPPPMAEAPMTRPGPSMARMFFQVKTGASISSPVSQRGMSWLPGQGASKGLVAGWADVGAVVVMERKKDAGGRMKEESRGRVNGARRGVARHDGRAGSEGQPCGGAEVISRNLKCEYPPTAGCALEWSFPQCAWRRSRRGRRGP